MSRRLIPFLCGLFLPILGSWGLATPAAAGEEVVETAHYRLHAQADRVTAEDYGHVLEAAWGEFERILGAAPALREGEHLEVRFLADRAAWEAAIREAGTEPPAGAGGYYWPPVRTAFLYRQPTSYFTRVLLLHEVAHQFHYLACTHNHAPSAAWYTEGVAEWLSWHEWDGEHLRLAVVPPVSLKDYPSESLHELRAPGFDLEAVVEGKKPASRPLSWAILAYLASGKDGQPVRGFEALRRKMDAGASVGPAWRSVFGSAARVLPHVIEFLEQHQQPWKQVFNEWEGIAPHEMRGHAAVVSLAIVKRPVTAISTSILPPPGRWKGGLVLHHGGPDDYTVALLEGDGGLRVDRREKGKWVRLAHPHGLAPGRDGLWHLRAVRRKGKVHLYVGDAQVGTFDLPGETFGLAVDASDVTFRAVTYE